MTPEIETNSIKGTGEGQGVEALKVYLKEALG